MAHLCHWPTCTHRVPPRLWHRLPVQLRRRIWAAYRPGQELDKNPSAAYLSIAKEVDEWCRREIQDGRAE